MSRQLQLQLEQYFTANPVLRHHVTFYTYNQNSDQSLFQILSNLRLGPNDHALVVVNETQTSDVQVNERLAGSMLK
jgi:hypothetical protein